MDDIAGRWALVTGASSGLGAHFAELLAERGASLVLVARRTGPMERLGAELRRRRRVEVVVEGMDLSRPGSAAELRSRLAARAIPVDVLVNNAGYGLYGPFVDQPLERLTKMVQLNVLALTELTHLLARDMVSRGRGHVLLTASLLGYQAVPGYAAYAATKAYVLLLGEALHRELAPLGVSVTALCPGPAATSFGEVAGQRDSPLLRLMTLAPRAVAGAGVGAMLRRRATVIPGAMSKAVVFLDRLMPRSLQRAALGRVVAG